MAGGPQRDVPRRLTLGLVGVQLSLCGPISSSASKFFFFEIEGHNSNVYSQIRWNLNDFKLG
jgi:hypothetical protein